MTPFRPTMRRLRCATSGITFFEVMVTVAVLAGGITMIYRAFLASFEYQHQLSCRYAAFNILSDRIAVMQHRFRTEQKIPSDENGREFEVTIDNRPVVFRQSVTFSAVGDLGDILALDAAVMWSDRGKSARVRRSGYLYLL